MDTKYYANMKRRVYFVDLEWYYSVTSTVFTF
jgi:hypothetical protein